MSRLVKYLPLLITLGVVAVFAVAFPSFAMLYIVEPVAIVLWAGWRVIVSVDQSVYWSLLIIVCSLLMIRVFSSGRIGAPSSEGTDQHEPRTRVERWQVLFQEAAAGEDQNAALRDSVGKLVTSALAQSEPSAPNDLEEALASRRIQMPAAARRYLSAAPIESRSTTMGQRLLHFAPSRLRRLIGKPAPTDRSDIDELLQWMESRMEIRHDQ